MLPTHRPDRLYVSLGPGAERYKQYLKAIALAVGEPGRKGDGSVSALLLRLAEIWENGATSELVAGINAAHAVALGGDEHDVLRIMEPFLPPIEVADDDDYDRADLLLRGERDG